MGSGAGARKTGAGGAATGGGGAGRGGGAAGTGAGGRGGGALAATPSAWAEKRTYSWGFSGGAAGASPGPTATSRPAVARARSRSEELTDGLGFIDPLCGANEADFHLTGANFGRDLPEPEIFDIRNVLSGDTSPDGKGKLVGDCDYASCEKVAGSITPVPGGVGPMTIACLLHNTVKAACVAKGIPVPAM